MSNLYGVSAYPQIILIDINEIEKLLTLKNYERIKTRDLFVEYGDFRFSNLGEEFNLFNGFFRSDF